MCNGSYTTVMVWLYWSCKCSNFRDLRCNLWITQLSIKMCEKLPMFFHQRSLRFRNIQWPPAFVPLPISILSNHFFYPWIGLAIFQIAELSLNSIFVIFHCKIKVRKFTQGPFTLSVCVSDCICYDANAKMGVAHQFLMVSQTLMQMLMLSCE